ncbi:E3 ubiquitin/ISG15 ligase TRIM25 [Scleropages formosus]|uniref:E3 ubiquitin/ISG15 ligase TRIM25-like n=1 Tax=Scleropages formosus TaxID=113540 RepID=A0A8C9RXB3_SCLFO|nr:E3 ubiquitin/ISG15 ligase TRIM25-like [Scleropages formosus]
MQAEVAMASSMEESVLEEELTCPVCLEFFRDPHLLPCGHNFCLLCVKRLKKQAERGRIKCPECRQTHRCGVVLQKNFRLANIAEEYRKRGHPLAEASTLVPATVACDYCLGEQAAAVKTCLKCEVSMCADHVRPHLERPAFREHPLAEPMSDLRKRRCPEHDEMFRYYCLDEKVCICNACTIEGNHSGHSIKTMKNTMKDLKGSLEIQLQKTSRKITKSEKTLQEFQNNEHESQSFFEETEQRVNTLGEVLHGQLEEFLSALRECARTHSGLSDIDKQQNLSKIRQDQARLQEVHTGIEALLRQNDPFSFLQEYSTTGKKLRRLLKKPLYSPEHEGVDTQAIAENMEAKLSEFQNLLKMQVFEVIDSVAAGHDGEEEEEGDGEEDGNISDEDSDDEENDDEEEEEEEGTESNDDLFLLNTDEDEQEDDDAEEEEEEEDEDI